MNSGYGFFPGGDPRNFTPDTECCSPDEIERHRLACEAWDRGDEEAIASGCVVLPDGGIVNISTFGLGVYMYWDDDDEEGSDDVNHEGAGETQGDSGEPHG